MKLNIKIGTRRSTLAMWQANWVAGRLERSGISCKLCPMDTTGDKMLDLPIPEIGSKGVFTQELERELASGSIDLAVHSAKDLPSELPDGFEIVAYGVRDQAHDVLVSFHQSLDLNQPLIIGTSSTRRTALFKHHFPKVSTVSVRGNLQTRLKKLETEKMDALALAYAGIKRLELEHLIKYHLPIRSIVPAAGQGSIAVEICKHLDPHKKSRIRDAINDEPTECRMLAERAFLHSIQGGCSIPAFAHATILDKNLTISGGIVSLDGSRIIQFLLEGTADQPIQLGESLGQKVLAAGGHEILKEIKQQMNNQ